MLNGITPSIPVIYAVCLALSVFSLICYMVFVKEKHITITLIFVSVCIVNTAYLYLSVSPSLAHALMANRLAYLGNVFQPLLLLMTVADICRIKINKFLKILMLAFAVFMFLSACSVGILPVFYKTAKYSVLEGVVKLVKTYGFLHFVYIVYVVSFMIAAILLTIHAIFKKKLVFYRYIVMTVLICSTNAAVWIIERIIGGSFEFMSVSYIFTCFMLVVIYSDMFEHGLSIDEADGIPITSNTKNELPIGVSEKFDEFIEKSKALTNAERNILKLYTEGCRIEDIPSQIFVSINTVRTHNRNIYRKLEVASKDELMIYIDLLRRCDRLDEIFDIAIYEKN